MFHVCFFIIIKHFFVELITRFNKREYSGINILLLVTIDAVNYDSYLNVLYRNKIKFYLFKKY